MGVPPVLLTMGKMPMLSLRKFPWPTALTVLRLLLVPVFLGLLIYAMPDRAGLVPRNANQLDHRRWLALAVFAFMAVTDNLDGYLARTLNQVSKLGTFLDPIADKILISAGLFLLVFPRFAPAGFAVPWPILWGVYQKDICVVIGALVVKYQLGKVEINANFAGKINTTVELSLVIATLLVPEWIAISPTFAAIFLWSLWYLTVAATAAAAIGYSREGARQLRAAAARTG
jgi:CDP-diacylglycerol--glycerol-3-phosphate 3-phosphatidyltransferase